MWPNTFTQLRMILLQIFQNNKIHSAKVRILYWATWQIIRELSSLTPICIGMEILNTTSTVQISDPHLITGLFHSNLGFGFEANQNIYIFMKVKKDTNSNKIF